MKTPRDDNDHRLDTLARELKVARGRGCAEAAPAAPGDLAFWVPNGPGRTGAEDDAAPQTAEHHQTRNDLYQRPSAWPVHAVRGLDTVAHSEQADVARRIEDLESKLRLLEGQAHGLPDAILACSSRIEGIEARLTALETREADADTSNLVMRMAQNLDTIGTTLEESRSMPAAIIEICAQLQALGEKLDVIGSPPDTSDATAKAILEAARRMEKLEAKVDASATEPDVILEISARLERLVEKLDDLEHRTASAVAPEVGRGSPQLVLEPGRCEGGAPAHLALAPSADERVVRAFEGLPFDSPSYGAVSSGDSSGRRRVFRRGDGAA